MCHKGPERLAGLAGSADPKRAGAMRREHSAGCSRRVMVKVASPTSMCSHLYQMAINSANQLANLRVTFEVTRELAGKVAPRLSPAPQAQGRMVVSVGRANRVGNPWTPSIATDDSAPSFYGWGSCYAHFRFDCSLVFGAFTTLLSVVNSALVI
jgi:hypothetical protein